MKCFLNCRSNRSRTARAITYVASVILTMLIATNFAIAGTTPIIVPAGLMNGHRDFHTATLLQNGLVLIAGGYDLATQQTPPTASAELYDPSTGLFKTTGNMNVARAFPSATLLPNGNVLIAGGFGQNGVILASAELYLVSTGTFVPTTQSMISARTGGPGGILLHNGKVLFAGGGNNNGQIQVAELYDFVADTFTATAGPMTTSRQGHTLTLLPSGQVLIAGGYKSGPLTSAELYDPATNMFAATNGAMNVPRGTHTSTLLQNGQVLLAGGATVNSLNNSAATATAELFDPSSGLFSLTGLMTVPFSDQVAIPLLDGRVFMTCNGTIGVNDQINNLYDPQTGGFTNTAAMTVPRFAGTATLLANGMVLETGGNSSSNTAELGDFAPGTFLRASGMNAAREFHTATPIVGGGVFIAGGKNANGAISSAEIYFDGTFLPATSMQTARAFHSATFFGTNGVLQGEVTFGGQDQNGNVTDSTDFYQFSNSGGTPHVNATFPFPHSGNPRMGHGASYFVSATSQPSILMTGGIDAAGHVRSDADVFAPTSWTPTTGALKANGRAFHTSTALLDGTILLTGGKDKTGSVLNSAETYSPITGLFTLTTGSMIHPRMFHTATLMNSGQVLLSGGTDGTAAEIASAEIYDPASGSFIAAPSMSNPRVFQSAAKLNDGDILVSGGQTNAPPSSQGNSLSPVFSADIFSAPLDQFAQPQGPMLHQHIAHTSTLLPNGLVLIAGGADSNGNISNTAEFYDPPNGPGVNAAVATPTNSRATTGAPGHRVNAGGFQVTNVSNMPESISAITVHVSDPMLLSSIQLDATVSRVKDTAIARAPEASNTLTFSSPVSIPAGGIANLKLTATMAKRAKHLPLHAHTVAAVTTIVIDGPSGPLDTMGLPIILNTVTLR